MTIFYAVLLVLVALALLSLAGSASELVKAYKERNR